MSKPPSNARPSTRNRLKPLIPPSQCPVARTANMIAGRWTALILRDLIVNEACRYQDLLDSLTGIAPNTLSDRLKMLEANGLVERRFYAEHPPRAEYLLTAKGRELAPVVKAMRAWGERHLDIDAGRYARAGRPVEE